MVICPVIEVSNNAVAIFTDTFYKVAHISLVPLAGFFSVSSVRVGGILKALRRYFLVFFQGKRIVFRIKRRLFTQNTFKQLVFLKFVPAVIGHKTEDLKGILHYLFQTGACVVPLAVVDNEVFIIGLKVMEKAAGDQGIESQAVHELQGTGHGSVKDLDPGQGFASRSDHQTVHALHALPKLHKIRILFREVLHFLRKEVYLVIDLVVIKPLTEAAESPVADGLLFIACRMEGILIPNVTTNRSYQFVIRQAVQFLQHEGTDDEVDRRVRSGKCLLTVQDSETFLVYGGKYDIREVLRPGIFHKFPDPFGQT